ncbi:MAG: hypothetical protein IPL61_07050 [Myxococcales bacterium]|nr:hypothetical protein [Myxococcales bacterium]
MRSPALALALVTAVAAACGSTPASDDIDFTDARVDRPDGGGGDTDATPDGGTNGAQFRRCVGRSYTPPAATGFTALGSILTAANGAAVHSGEDPIGAPGSAPHLIARFQYGSLAANLADEPVEVVIDDCAGWQALGTHTTAADGTVDVPVTLPLGPGQYEARFTVLGDASTTVGYLWILPAATHLVATDIDGTLTTSDTELFVQILFGSYVPAAYPDATALTTAHAAKHHVMVYVTGRPAYLTAKSREWLTDLGFAPGPLRLAPTATDTLPFDANVGTYKRDYLAGLASKGYLLDLAYGNATTDIFAYTGAGLPGERQWIIGTNGGTSGTHAVTDSWTARVAEVGALAPVVQPFQF